MATRNETLEEAVARADREAKAEMEANRAAGREVQGVGVVSVPLAPGESPDLTVLLDKQYASLRARVAAGQVKLVVFQSVEQVGGSLNGCTEVITDTKSLDPAVTLWAVQNDMAGLIANNVYEAVGRAVAEHVKVITDHALCNINKAEKADEN